MEINAEQNSVLLDSSCHTQMKIIKIRFIWKISNFSLICQKDASQLYSSEFPSESEQKYIKCKLVLFPNGVNEKSKDFISLYVQFITLPKPKLVVALSTFIVDIEGKRNKQGQSEKTVFKEGESFGNSHYVSRSVLEKEKDKLLPNDTLTVLCEITAGIEIKNCPYQNNLQDCDNNNHSQISLDFEALLNNKNFSDITFIAEKKEIQAHKAIIGARSPVFAAMFQHDLKEKHENIVKIDDIKYEVLKEMLRYIYCSKIKNLKNIAEELLAVAEKYEIKRLKDTCEMALCKKLAINNAVTLLDLADLYRADKLKKLAINFINANAADLIKTPEFKTLSNLKPYLIVEIFNERIDIVSTKNIVSL